MNLFEPLIEALNGMPKDALAARARLGDQVTCSQSVCRKDAGSAILVMDKKTWTSPSPHDKIRLIALHIGFRQVKR